MTLEQEAIAREKAIALVNAKIGLQVEDLQDVINVISDAIERALEPVQAERDHWKSLALLMGKQFEEETRPEEWDNGYLKVEDTSAK